MTIMIGYYNIDLCLYSNRECIYIFNIYFFLILRIERKLYIFLSSDLQNNV